MSDQSGIRVFRPEDRRDASDAATPGMHRLEADAGAGFWLGTVTTDPNVISGWHHHAGYETVIYVLRGSARLDAWVDGEIQRYEAPAGSSSGSLPEPSIAKVAPARTGSRRSSSGSARAR